MRGFELNAVFAHQNPGLLSVSIDADEERDVVGFTGMRGPGKRVQVRSDKNLQQYVASGFATQVYKHPRVWLLNTLRPNRRFNLLPHSGLSGEHNTQVVVEIRFAMRLHVHKVAHQEHGLEEFRTGHQHQFRVLAVESTDSVPIEFVSGE